MKVSQVVLFGDEKALRKAKEKYPDRIIPFLSPYGIYRKLLSQLRPEAADNIAHKTILSVLKK